MSRSESSVPPPFRSARREHVPEWVMPAIVVAFCTGGLLGFVLAIRLVVA